MDKHQPVLTTEALAGLAVTRDGCYVDGTYGRGGHSAAILQELGDEGRLLALDRDPEAVADGQQRFGDDYRFAIRHAGFARSSVFCSISAFRRRSSKLPQGVSAFSWTVLSICA